MTEAVPGWEMLVMELGSTNVSSARHALLDAGERAVARIAGLNTASEVVCSRKEQKSPSKQKAVV